MHVEQKYLTWMVVKIFLFVNDSLPQSFFFPYQVPYFCAHLIHPHGPYKSCFATTFAIDN